MSNIFGNRLVIKSISFWEIHLRELDRLKRRKGDKNSYKTGRHKRNEIVLLVITLSIKLVRYQAYTQNTKHIT